MAPERYAPEIRKNEKKHTTETNSGEFLVCDARAICTHMWISHWIFPVDTLLLFTYNIYIYIFRLARSDRTTIHTFNRFPFAISRTTYICNYDIFCCGHSFWDRMVLVTQLRSCILCAKNNNNNHCLLNINISNMHALALNFPLSPSPTFSQNFY